MFGFRKRRRARLRATPLSAADEAALHERVHLFHRLAAADQEELRGHVQVLLHEKSFEGCGGLELTRLMEVVIAGNAAILMLHRAKPTYFPGCNSILVYPHAYLANATRPIGGGMTLEGREVRLGESWQRGSVVLAWDAIERRLHGAGKGHNVILHEFAHQLDSENGAMDGLPALPTRAAVRAWAEVFTAEYEALRAALATGTPTTIDPYGATNPAEFFAVVVELFFERPAALRRHHAALYDQLAAYFHQHPATWPVETDG